jgi:hypothetical protein
VALFNVGHRLLLVTPRLEKVLHVTPRGRGGKGLGFLVLRVLRKLFALIDEFAVNWRSAAVRNEIVLVHADF